MGLKIRVSEKVYTSRSKSLYMDLVGHKASDQLQFCSMMLNFIRSKFIHFTLPGWHASPLQGFQHLIHLNQVIVLDGERHSESEVSCPRKQCSTDHHITVNVYIDSVVINCYNLYSVRLQETKTGSPVLMQEDTNRTLYKPQVYFHNVN